MEDISTQGIPPNQPPTTYRSPDSLGLPAHTISFFRRAQLEMDALGQEWEGSFSNQYDSASTTEDLAKASFLQSGSTLKNQETFGKETVRLVGNCDDVRLQSNLPGGLNNQGSREIGQPISISVPRTVPTPLETLPEPFNHEYEDTAKNMDILVRAVELEVKRAADAASLTWAADTSIGPIGTSRHRAESDDEVRMDAHDSVYSAGRAQEACSQRISLRVVDNDRQTAKSPLSQDSPPTSSASIWGARSYSNSSQVSPERQAEAEYSENRLSACVSFTSDMKKGHLETALTSPPRLRNEYHCSGCARPDVCKGIARAIAVTSWFSPPKHNISPRQGLPYGCPLDERLGPTRTDEQKDPHAQSNELKSEALDDEIMLADGEGNLGRTTETSRLSDTVHVATAPPGDIRGGRCSSCPPTTNAESPYAQGFLFGRPKLDKSGGLEKLQRAGEARQFASSQEQSSRQSSGDGIPHRDKQDLPETRLAPSNLDLLNTAGERKQTETGFVAEPGLNIKKSGGKRRLRPMKLSERVREKLPAAVRKHPKSPAPFDYAAPELEDLITIKKRLGRKRQASLSDAEDGPPATRVPHKRAKNSDLSVKEVTRSRRKRKTYWTYISDISDESSVEPPSYEPATARRLRNGRLIAAVTGINLAVDTELQVMRDSQTPSSRPRSESIVTTGEIRSVAGRSRGLSLPRSRQRSFKPAIAPRASFTDKTGKFVVTLPKGLTNAKRSPEPEFTYVQPQQPYMNPRVSTGQVVCPPLSPGLSPAQGIFEPQAGSASDFGSDVGPSTTTTTKQLPTQTLSFDPQIHYPSSFATERTRTPLYRQASEPAATTEATETTLATRTIDRRGRIKRKGHIYLADLETIVEKGTKRLQKGGWEYVPEDEFQSSLNTPEPMLLSRRTRRGTAAL